MKLRIPGLIALTILSVQSVSAASAPDEVTGLVYSSTAAEIFWPRVAGPVVAYVVSRNGEELGVFDALSYFDDTLEPDNRYVYSVASVEADGTRSEAVSTEIIIGNVGDQEPVGELASPTNLSQEIYSDTATEFFWDRVNTSSLVYEIRLNGEPVGSGTTDGISTYIDSLVPGTDYTFSVVAVASDASARSAPVELSFQMPGTGGSEPDADEPVSTTAAQTTLENVLRTINNNAHDRVKFGLFALDFSADVPAPGLTPRDANADVTEDRTFDCSGGGTLLAAPRETGAVATFEDCNLDNTLRTGIVNISKGSEDDALINMVYSGYQETQIATDPRDNVVVEIPNGIFEKRDNVSQPFNFSREFMATPLLYSVNTRAGLESVKDLQRNSSYYRDVEDPAAAVELRVSFESESFWTSGNVMDVDTAIVFSNFDAITGYYTTGKLSIVEDSSVALTGTQTPTGNSIELDADTGDANTYLFTVIEGDAVTSELRNWADLPEALPCPISAIGVVLEEDCR